MKAVWLTDIHLNFLKYNQRQYFLKEMSRQAVDCFFISGDIGEAESIVPFLQQIESAVKRPIYFVMGNHDFYGGSIKAVRSEVFDLTKKSQKLIWLNKSDYISLTKETALVGHDSWADGRFGDFNCSSVELNDFRYIKELKLSERNERLKTMQKLADEAVEHFRKVLPKALKKHRRIVVLTHVPPFKEACRHNGQPSQEEWLPYFSCKAVGDVLKDIMEQNPKSEMTVLCGHTHGQAECRILPNLLVYAGRAEYGQPEIQKTFKII